MSPQKRRQLDPRSKKFEVRFAIQLRGLLDRAELGPTEFVAKIKNAGVDYSVEAVKKWLSGQRIPRPQDVEKLGRILGLDDYRKIWPPPI